MRNGPGWFTRPAADPVPSGMPADVLGVSRTAVLLEVLARPGVTVPRLMDRTGLSRAVVHYHLRALRAEGLINWRDYRTGTVRADVAVVAHGGPSRRTRARLARR